MQLRLSDLDHMTKSRQDISHVTLTKLIVENLLNFAGDYKKLHGLPKSGVIKVNTAQKAIIRPKLGFSPTIN